MSPQEREVTLTGRIALDVYRATKFGKLELAARLIRRHVQTNGSTEVFFELDEHGESPFDLWARTRSPDLLSVLSEYDIPWTPHFAARWGQLEKLQELVGEDESAAHARDAHGDTLMHCALAYNQLAVARWLLERGFDVRDAKEAYVMAAARSRSEDAVRFAVDHGAPIDGSSDTRTALHEECEQGYSKLIPCLLELGADPNAAAPDHAGDRPLHFAALRPNGVPIARMLLAGGADPTALNDKGESAADAARGAGHDAIVELLRDADAGKQ